LGRGDWAREREAWLNRLESEIGYPCFVKPLTLGSSVGIAYVKDREELARYIDIAANLDRYVLVEPAAKGEQIIEINCAVLGGDVIRASALEQPVTKGPLLGWDQKYEGKASAGMKSQQRIIPAPIDPAIYAQIQATAVQAFQAIRGRGTARLDFLMDQATGRFWLNEINTMPGSLAFYLWEQAGLSAGGVCDELIQIALDDQAQKRQTTYNYKSRLIELAASQQGSKGAKS
jgi:D-alanine-D-alanine ligase